MEITMKDEIKKSLLSWNLEERKWYRYGEACLKAKKDPDAYNSFEIYTLLKHAEMNKVIAIAYSSSKEYQNQVDLSGSFQFEYLT